MRPEFFRRQFLAPRHWPVWLLFAVQRACVWLPWRLQRALGWLLGDTARRLASTRRAIARDNLRRVYPRAEQQALDELLKAHFRNLGIGLMELGMAWWGSSRRLARLCDVEGLQHLPHADQPQACFLVAGHFTSMDMVGRGLSLYCDFDALHRPLGKPLVDALTYRGRSRCVQRLIDKRQPKALLKSLHDQRTIWIAVDQADTTAASVVAPFFGIPVATNTTVGRLAGRYKARVLPISCIRQSNGRYRIRIEPPLPDFGDDALRDATTLNAMVERHIAAAPSQYYWIHRRFKQAANA